MDFWALTLSTWPDMQHWLCVCGELWNWAEWGLNWWDWHLRDKCAENTSNLCCAENMSLTHLCNRTSTQIQFSRMLKAQISQGIKLLSASRGDFQGWCLRTVQQNLGKRLGCTKMLLDSSIAVTTPYCFLWHVSRELPSPTATLLRLPVGGRIQNQLSSYWRWIDIDLNHSYATH